MDAKQELTIILDDCKLISDRFNAYQKYKEYVRIRRAKDKECEGQINLFEE